ncbi:MAG: hypothetical protein RR957_07900, partial [Oscillospiraceae bacterium]
KSMAMVLSIAIIFSSFGVLANAQSDNTNEVIQMPLPITQDEGLKKQPKDEDLMAELIQPSGTATPVIDSNIDVKAATGEVDAGLSQVGTNGYTNETIERYKDFKYADPNYITDEIFFGKWNKNTLKWDKEPYLNYDNGTLIEAEKEVKNGDYKAAKEKTLAYYREKFINQPRKYPTNVSRIQKLTADFESYNLFFNKATGIDATDLVTVPKNGGYVQMNILEDTQKAAKSPGQQERNYILVAIEKDGTLANFNTKENSDNKPYVEATVNGVKKRFPIVKDTMVSPDSNKAKNYGSEPIISVEESNSSITEKIDGVKPIDSNTKRVYVNVDFSGLGSGDDITESYLYMYGSTNNPNGKKIGVLTNINANMVENTFTWGSTEHLLFSYDGESGPKWDWAANGAGLNYMGYRFNEEQNRFENFASCMSNSYKATGDEVYAYHMLRLMLNFYQKRGQNPGYRNNLDLGCRAQSFPILMATFIDSEFMTP